MQNWRKRESSWQDDAFKLVSRRENFQRLQQDLAHMILACLEQRARGSIRRKKPVSSPSREDDKGQESEAESEGSHLEYLHMATVDNTLSTFL